MNSTFTNAAGYAYTGIIKGHRGSTAEAYANKQVKLIHNLQESFFTSKAYYNQGFLSETVDIY
jgi:hypothetical protein